MWFGADEKADYFQGPINRRDPYAGQNFSEFGFQTIAKLACDTSHIRSCDQFPIWVRFKSEFDSVRPIGTEQPRSAPLGKGAL